MRKSFFVVLGLCCFFLLSARTSFAATSYTVQPGDTLYLISQPYGLTPQQLMQANGLASCDIYPGQVLNISSTQSAPTATSQYTIKPGDSLYLIAQRYNTTSANLSSCNNLSTTTIYPGQVLTIPATAGGQSTDVSATGSGTSTSQYTVRSGDTLYLIASAHGTTVANIKSCNNLTSNDLYPGQVVLLPSGASNSSPNAGNSEASRGTIATADSYLLAQLIYAEACGETFEGQVAVGAVVLNRVHDSRFPKTVRDVIYDTWQFEPVQNGRINQVPDQNARRAANAALTGWDPSKSALYFYNPDKAQSSYFQNSLTYLCRIGNHVFYK